MYLSHRFPTAGVVAPSGKPSQAVLTSVKHTTKSDKTDDNGAAKITSAVSVTSGGGTASGTVSASVGSATAVTGSSGTVGVVADGRGTSGASGAIVRNSDTTTSAKGSSLSIDRAGAATASADVPNAVSTGTH